MTTAKEQIKANQLNKAEEVEKRDTKLRVDAYNSDPRNRPSKEGTEGLINKPKSSVGLYKKSLEMIEKYNNLSKAEQDKLNKMEKEKLQQAKMYVKEIASQTSHKSLNRNNRPLMQDAEIGE
tara:strand:+ start:2087 stop:2452 length:366 start_codon:yes stop_codon:yes gene_type:complete